jgi:hypothetical protein
VGYRVTDMYRNFWIEGLLWHPQLHPSPNTITTETVGYLGLVHSFLDVLLSSSVNVFVSAC